MSLKTPVSSCISVSSSDATGAVGIQADLKTFSALGCYGTGVITAVGSTVHGNTPVILDTDSVIEQLRFAVEYNGVNAIKLGMLHTPHVVEALVEELEPLSKYAHIVADPSFIARGEQWLTERETAEHIRDDLLPLCTVATPNIAEAQWLLNTSLPDSEAIERAAKELLQLGPKAALIKGGHRHGAYSDDLLAIQYPETQRTVTWFRSARVSIDRGAGAGCTLSSGITAGIAAGKGIALATEEAKIYLTAALRAGSRWGNAGKNGPLHHFYAWWNHDAGRR
ncbi:MAG: bifunctional hydroxymethylpyrimidine kinase/phosphomethylpyrimidine kinase [Spirochaetota bacterium]